MKKLYIVFEQIPSPESGGLVTMYRRVEALLKDTYDIYLISAFDCPQSYKDQFESPIISLNKTKIDITFVRFMSYLKNGKIQSALFALYSAFLYFIYAPFARIKTKKIIKEEDKTIVTCPSAGMFISNKIPFILELHTQYDAFWNHGFMRKLQIYLMAKPRLILFRTKMDAMKGSKHYPSDYIYNFFDNTEIQSDFNLEKKKNRFIFLARLSKEKNPIRMIHIIRDVCEKHPELIVDVYGTGVMEQEMKEEIKKWHLENNIFMKGFTNNKNIYKDYTALLMTSDFEGFPLAVIEAKANGIPTISTNWGLAITEVISDGTDGFIANDNLQFMNYMTLLMNNPAILEKMSINARKDFIRFSQTQAKKNYIKFIENL